jgi:hypothetical protein
MMTRDQVAEIDIKKIFTKLYSKGALGPNFRTATTMKNEKFILNQTASCEAECVLYSKVRAKSSLQIARRAISRHFGRVRVVSRAVMHMPVIVMCMMSNVFVTAMSLARMRRLVPVMMVVTVVSGMVAALLFVMRAGRTR